MPALKNARHERYAQERAKGKSATEAMKLAGLRDPRNSTRLTNNDEISARIAELQGRAAERVEITLASLLAEAEDARRLAMQIEQPAAAIAAIKEKGVLSGVRVERSKLDATVTSAQTLTDDELAVIATASRNGTAETEDHPKVTH